MVGRFHLRVLTIDRRCGDLHRELRGREVLRWLSQLSLITHTADIQVLESITRGNVRGYQDQVFVNRVPEPSSVALALIALLGVGVVSCRRRH